MRIVSFNANGLRSAAKKGFFDWFATHQADVLCVQETKAQAHQLEDALFRPAGYHVHFKDASTKKGYSGVAIYSRREPDAVLTDMGRPSFDDEGRYIEARFGNLSVVSLYIPSGTSGELRQTFKYEAMAWLAETFARWQASGRDYVLCGDWNIVHTERDIKNWRSNQKNSGCLPEERAWLGQLFGTGWIDSYRHLTPEGRDYTWWSSRGQARGNDVGWRIDYQVVTPSLQPRLRACSIAKDPHFSDHAPFTVDYHD